MAAITYSTALQFWLYIAPITYSTAVQFWSFVISAFSALCFMYFALGLWVLESGLIGQSRCLRSEGFLAGRGREGPSDWIRDPQG